MKTPRRRAREFVVQGLYQALINQTSENEILNNIKLSSDFSQADESLFSGVFTGAYQNQKEYIEQISPLLDRNEKELSPIERAVLLMAYYELSSMPETPYPVIINEAIEVTKTFGGTDGHKFVNGVLDKLVATLRPNDKKRK